MYRHRAHRSRVHGLRVEGQQWFFYRLVQVYVLLLVQHVFLLLVHAQVLFLPLGHELARRVFLQQEHVQVRCAFLPLAQQSILLLVGGLVLHVFLRLPHVLLQLGCVLVLQHIVCVPPALHVLHRIVLLSPAPSALQHIRVLVRHR